MSESPHAPASGPVTGPQFQDLSEDEGDSEHEEGDADMDGVVQPDVHQTTEEMFSHVDHEDYVSSGAPSNQIAILPLEGKGGPPPDPQLSSYIPYFKHGKARKVEWRDDFVKKFDGRGQDDVLQVIALREDEKGEEGFLGPRGNLCGAQGKFRFQPKERRFQPKESKKKNGRKETF